MNQLLRTARTGTVLGLVAVVGLLGCSDDSSTTTTEESTGTTQQVVAPIIVDGAEELTVEVGATLDIVTDGVTGVTSSDEAVLEPSQPSTDGSAVFNAGATALAPGDASLTVSGESGVLYTVEVEVL